MPKFDLQRLAAVAAVAVGVAACATDVGVTTSSSPSLSVTASVSDQPSAASSLGTETGDDTADATPEADGVDADVLSSCEPAASARTVTLVESGGPRPQVAAMEEALADNPDAQFIMEGLQADGVSREDAVHDLYAQVVGQRLVEDATRWPGYLAAAIAQPLEGKPFQLSFSDAIPEELNPDQYDLASFGLVVTTAAVGVNADTVSEVMDEALAVGIRAVAGSADELTGTGEVEVLDATPEQVAAWEQAIDNPQRWCLIRAARAVACDETVISDAQDRAVLPRNVLPNGQLDGEPTIERARQVRRSYLGLSVEESRGKATEEGREVRVVVEDGVPLGGTDDFVGGRLSLTVCDGVVVDTLMDGEA